MDGLVICDYCGKSIPLGEVVTNVGDSFAVILACEKCAESREAPE